MGSLIGPAIAEERFGIQALHEEMDNGELRFRLLGSDGNAYIRTVATCGGWQKSHSHRCTYEMYIVETGWMAFATLLSDGITLKVEIFTRGSLFTTPLNVPHNVYLPSGATIHTVKFGSAVKIADWFSCEILNNITNRMTETEILRHNIAGL